MSDQGSNASAVDDRKRDSERVENTVMPLCWVSLESLLKGVAL